MRTKVIKADRIDSAVEQILDELKENDTARSISSRNNNVIYFDGWDGLGASTVLRTVAQRLAVASEAPAGLKFDQIIHIDCSKWESRRVLQRAIAEQLELPAPMMDMLDRQDEEDKFNGVSLASRLEIPQVLRGMYRRIQELNRRFLVIFHNGGNEEIDLASFGFPLSQYLDNKVLWTFQGRFRLYPRNKVVGGMKSTAGTSKTDVFLSAHHSLGGKELQELCTILVHQEASEVIAQSEITINTSNGHAQVGEHFLLHMLKLCCIGHNFSMDYDLANHACNYWVCDGIIQHQGDDISTNGDDDDGLWRAAGDLQCEMRLDVDNYQYEAKYLPTQLVRSGICMMPNKTPLPNGFLVIPAGAIPNADMFQDFNKLNVLKLSRRTFSFSSPPFIYCHNLKFLWLDHCEDQDHIRMDGFPQEEDEDRFKADGAGTEDDFQRCFQRLWVLDVRYTSCDQILSARMLDFMTQLRELNVMGAQDWDIGQLQGRLSNIRKLRVTKSTLDCSEHNLLLGMSKMELLDLSGNQSTQGVTKLSGICTSSNQLETVTIIHGWAGIQKVSFQGCAKLRNVLLSGLFEDLHTLDLSGTAVRTLDLSAMTARKMCELFLDNCWELCAIVWPPKDGWKSTKMKLHIDTTGSAASLVPLEEKSIEGRTTPSAMITSAPSLSVVHGGRSPSVFDLRIVVRDARLLRSLMPFVVERRRLVHVEISSPAVDFGSGKDNEAVSTSSSIKQQNALANMEQPEHNNRIYGDVAVASKDHLLVQASEGDGGAPTHTRVWPCPRIPYMDKLTWYIHAHARSAKPRQEGEGFILCNLCEFVGILHMHDSSSITSIPSPAPAPTMLSPWQRLNWCRVERCPNLECVFTAPKPHRRGSPFEELKTFWASQLLKAHCIWSWVPEVFELCDREIGYYLLSFRDLTLLHLDFCPRLIYVLSTKVMFLESIYDIVYQSYGIYSYIRGLNNLQTLEIVWCGALREVFSLSADGPDYIQQTTVTFKNLRHIHLHELPMLQGICGRWSMNAPLLETVKIRGCWSLRRLPLVEYRYGPTRERRERSQLKKVHCDCEKEWWDQLQWEGLDHRSWYEPTHPRHYKKTLLRGSVLR